MGIAEKMIKFVENQNEINEKLNGDFSKQYENGYDLGYGEGYTNGVASVPNPLEYVLQVTYGGVAFPDGYELEIDMPIVDSMFGLMPRATGVKKVTIKGNKDKKALEFNNAFESTTIEIIDMSEFEIVPKKCDYAFYNDQYLREIKGVIDNSQCTSATKVFDNCYALEELRFAPGSIAYGLPIPYSPLLSAETRQSIVDGLNSATGGVLYLHSDVSSKFTDEQILEITNKNWSIQ